MAIINIKQKPIRHKAIKFDRKNIEELVDFVGNEGYVQIERRLNGGAVRVVKSNIRHAQSIEIKDGEVMYFDEQGNIRKLTEAELQSRYEVEKDFYEKECQCGCGGDFREHAVNNTIAK